MTFPLILSFGKLVLVIVVIRISHPAGHKISIDGIDIIDTVDAIDTI